MYDKEALIALVRHKALKFGDFTLTSGKKATYYLDGKQVTLDAHGAKLIAEGILDLLGEGEMPAAIGGMVIGADPITSSVVTMSAVPRNASGRIHGPQRTQGPWNQSVHRGAR